MYRITELKTIKYYNDGSLEDHFFKPLNNILKCSEKY